MSNLACVTRNLQEVDVFSLTAARPKLIGLALLCICGGSSLSDTSSSAPAARGMSSDGRNAVELEYLEANGKAMARMMRDMHIQPTGDVDRDFVAQMVAHHQGGIDMAIALLHTGGNEALKRLAQEIIVTQNDEIAAMRLAIGESPIGLEHSK